MEEITYNYRAYTIVRALYATVISFAIALSLLLANRIVNVSTIGTYHQSYSTSTIGEIENTQIGVMQWSSDTCWIGGWNKSVR